MRVKIEFDIDNAAFQGDFKGEVSKVLEQSHRMVYPEPLTSKLYDSNGNKIGSVRVYRQGIRNKKDKS